MTNDETLQPAGHLQDRRALHAVAPDLHYAYRQRIEAFVPIPHGVRVVVLGLQRDLTDCPRWNLVTLTDD